jgi:phosphate acetyltransferase
MSQSPFLSSADPICPPDLLALAQKGTAPRVAIARAGAALPMQAAKEAVDAGIMIPVFTGERDQIEAQASALNWDISGFTILEAEGEAAAGLAAAEACGRGEADVIMKGHLHTDVFMKSVLNRDAGLRTGNRLVHIFHMSHPDGGKPLLISDAAVNVNPDMETRKAAVQSVVDMLHILGNSNPNIALLSATESAIPSVPSSMEAAELAEWAKSEVKGANVAGPLALDLILSGEAAKTKGFDNPVAGNADAVIVPDIVSGNTLFKALVYTKGACAAGVVMGARVPVLLTSRADPAAARLASAALAAILHNG